MTSKLTEIAVDCADPADLARFWCAVLGYEVQDEEDGLVTIGSPEVPEGKRRRGPVPPALTFARVPEGKTVKNRLHLDVRTAPGLDGDERMDALEAECSRLTELGGTRLRRVDPDPPLEHGFIVMADPEGNEFCLD